MSEPQELILGGESGKGFYPIERKLVIAVTSSALFDMTESNGVFIEEGHDKYCEYQIKNISNPLKPGVAFPFISRLLSLNTLVYADSITSNVLEKDRFIEVVLFSRESPATGLRVFRSIKHYGLDISRACFSSGNMNFQYLKTFNSVLYISTNGEDVKEARDAGFPAGLLLPQPESSLIDPEDQELRIAFDFDGVIADLSAEKVSQERGIDGFADYESEHAQIPFGEGLLKRFLEQILQIQRFASDFTQDSPNTKRKFIRTAVITARNALVYERAIITLNAFGIEVDEVFFLGGIDKARILNVFRPHLFFDDKLMNLKHLEGISCVQIVE